MVRARTLAVHFPFTRFSESESVVKFVCLFLSAIKKFYFRFFFFLATYYFQTNSQLPTLLLSNNTIFHRIFFVFVFILFSVDLKFNEKRFEIIYILN